MSSSPNINNRRSFAVTKTNRPRLPKILERQRCLDALRTAVGHRIIHISGRAGQGKTTLALAWLKETKTKSVWVNLDEGDSDPIAFFRLLAEAFSAAFPRTRFDIPSIPTGAPFEPKMFARIYWPSLLSQVPGRYSIVLDDLHTVDENGPLPPVLEVLIDSLSPNNQLILMSRQFPSSFFAKWIAARQLFSVTEETLRFSVKEVESLYTSVFDTTITPSQAEFLHGMLEGWVTGLILVHESGKGTVEGIGGKPFLRVGSGDRIFDYLYHEVFRRLDPSLQMTMMRLALVDSFSIKSASRLISGADLSAQIRFLLGHHLIYETPVEDQIRFRYHPLLQQFLRNQVRTLPKIELQTLVDQVGAADEAEAMVDHAITLYLEYGHHDQAIRLIEEIGLRYTLEGKRHLLRQWVRSVPTERLALHPWLRYFLGNDQAFFNPVEAQESYRLAVAGFEKNGDLEGQLWARSSRMMLSVYAGFDFRPIKEDAKWGEQTIKGRIGSSLARASFLLADAFSGLAATDNPQHALRKALEAAELARQAGSNMLSARALTRAGFSAGYLGHHRQAMSLFDQSEAVCAWEKLDPPLRAEALIYRGLVETYRGDKILSRKYLLEAQQICLEFGLKAQLPLMQSYLIWSRVTLGEREEGDDSLEPVRKQLLASGNFYFAAAISHSQAVLSLEGGNLLEALRHEEESLRLVQRCHTRFLLLIPLAVLGAIWGELRERTKAEKYLQRALAGFERAGSDMFSFMALMHLAKISLDHGDEEKTKKYLTRALHCGKNERYLVGEGIRPKMMGSLLSRARQWGIEPRYVESLIDFWQIRPESPLKIYTLGRFELILDGQPIPEQAWRGRKTQLLLIALLSLGAGEHKEKIMDLLWPDSDGDRAVINFHTTLHRLQSVFGHTDKESGFIRLLYGRLSLNPISCWSDCDAFEKAAHQARDAQSAGRWSEAERHLQKAHALYQGDYLPTFSQEIWIEEKRRKLRSEFDWVRRNLKT